MAKPQIITGLDIGSGSIKILSIFLGKKEDSFEVASFYKEDSFGVRRGVVVDPQKVSEIISLLIKKTEDDCQRKIQDVYISIGGCHLSCEFSHGLVSVSRADRKISKEDIERVLNNAQMFPLASNKEIINVLPKGFSVDGEKNIKEAIGLQGLRLEVDILALCGFSPYIKNTSQAVNSAGLETNEFIFSSLASSKAVLTLKEQELGVVLLDIGSGVTSMAVFEEGNLIYTAVLPVGSGSITSDIAICFKIDFSFAEKIKLEFGSCRMSGKMAKSEKKIKIDPSSSNEGEGVEFSTKTLNKIIEARVAEIFDLANKELKKISRQALLPAGVVLTGGGSKLAGIKDLAKEKMKLSCRIGIPTGFSSALEDPSFSVVCGLVKNGIEIKKEEGNGFSSGIIEKIINLFKEIVP